MFEPQDMPDALAHSVLELPCLARSLALFAGASVRRRLKLERVTPLAEFDMRHFQTNLREILVDIAIIGLVLGGIKWVYELQPKFSGILPVPTTSFQPPEASGNSTLPPPCEPGDHEAYSALFGQCICIKCGSKYTCGPVIIDDKQAAAESPEAVETPAERARRLHNESI